MTLQEVANKADWEGGYLAFARWAGHRGIDEIHDDAYDRAHVTDVRLAFRALLDAAETLEKLLPDVGNVE